MIEPPWPTFFVLARDTAVELGPIEARLAGWLLAELSGWVQVVVLEMLADGRIEIVEEPIDGARTPGLVGHERLFVVRCPDRCGPRRPGFWAARCVGEAVAEFVGGELVDPRRLALGLPTPLELRPPSDARVHLVDHLGLPCSRGPGRNHWLTTVGMAHFGLPDLQVEAVPTGLTEHAARLLLGVAQHLVDGSAAVPKGSCSREVLVTLGELHWALGRPIHPPSLEGSSGSRGRGWTRLVLSRSSNRLARMMGSQSEPNIANLTRRAKPTRSGGRAQGARARSASTRLNPASEGLIEVGPPIAARSKAPSQWITHAWLDLVGHSKARGRSIPLAETG